MREQPLNIHSIDAQDINPPDISIILPCYNVARYLKKCIISIWENDFSNYEMIFINDCSTDDTLDILKGFAEEDSRIKIIDLKKNGGLANGRKVGIQAAQGKYIAFIDPDDWIDNGYLSTLYKYVKQDPSLDLVIMPFCYKEFRLLPSIKADYIAEFLRDKFGKTQVLTPQSRIMETFFGRTVISITAWSKLYRTDILRDLPEINVFYQEDLFLNLFASLRIKKYLITNEIMYHYRSGGGSATNPKLIQDLLEGFRIKKEWLKQNIPNYKEHYPWICFELKNNIYGWIARLIDNGESKDHIKEIYNKTITQDYLDFLASTKDSAPESYNSEDFQALLSKDFDRIYTRATSRVSKLNKIKKTIRKLLSY